MAARNTNTTTNAGGIQRARQIANRNQTPLQQAATNAGRTTTNTSPVATDPYLPGPSQTNAATPTRGLPPNTQGPAGAANAAIRNGGSTTPPIIYENAFRPDPVSKEPVVTAVARPNPEYVKDIPPPPPTPDPERPIPEKTESIAATEIDKIIEESDEVVKEVETKQDPVRPPVITTQDEVVPPPPITPTELVLEAQANCEKEVETPTINIVNENNNEINIDLATTATASIAPVITVPELRRGCTDPDALNYDPEALLDDGSCKFEPVVDTEPVDPTEPPPPPPLEIPDTITFVDSHGEPIFTVLKEEVTKTEQTDEDGFATVRGKEGDEPVIYAGETLVADLKLVDDITRPALEDSDLILSIEDEDVANRKNTREALGGELASDVKLGSDQEIIIIGDREQRVKPLTRNDNGIIFLDEDTNSKLKVSLRSRAFNFNQYKRIIDTSFSELIGKP